MGNQRQLSAVVKRLDKSWNDFRTAHNVYITKARQSQEEAETELVLQEFDSMYEKFLNLKLQCDEAEEVWSAAERVDDSAARKEQKKSL